MIFQKKSLINSFLNMSLVSHQPLNIMLQFKDPLFNTSYIHHHIGSSPVFISFFSSIFTMAGTQLLLLVGYFALAVTLANAENHRAPGGKETLVNLVQERKALDKTLDGYDLAETLSQYPRIIYSSVTRRALGRALGDASAVDLGRASAIASSTCASHVSQIIDDLSVPELYALNREYFCTLCTVNSLYIS